MFIYSVRHIKFTTFSILKYSCIQHFLTVLLKSIVGLEFFNLFLSEKPQSLFLLPNGGDLYVLSDLPGKLLIEVQS